MGKGSGCLFGLVGLLGFGALVVIGGNSTPQPGLPAAPAASTPVALSTSEREALAAANLEFKVNRWSKGGFGTVAEIDVTITNRKKADIKDIVIRCRFSGESGTVLLRVERTAYRNFPVGQAVRIRSLNFGFIPQEAARAGCEPIGFAS